MHFAAAFVGEYLPLPETRWVADQVTISAASVVCSNKTAGQHFIVDCRATPTAAVRFVKMIGWLECSGCDPNRLVRLVK